MAKLRALIAMKLHGVKTISLTTGKNLILRTVDEHSDEFNRLPNPGKLFRIQISGRSR